jgi:hypothetical protein
MAIVGGSMLALPLTTGPLSLTAVAIVMSNGNGNGIGSGIIITLGADTAPRRGRTIGLTGGLAVGALALWVPKHSPYATPAAMRAHRAPAERSRDPATPD